MTTTKTKTGEILSPVLWSALADEYLNGVYFGASQVRAEVSAGLLGEYVDQQVSDANAGSYWFAGSWWAETTDPEPYANLDEMGLAWAAGLQPSRAVLVSNQYCDHPVWTPTQNVKFRVWHDTGHILEGHGFDPDGELALFAEQARQLVRADRSELVDPLFSESVYQLAACISLGGFPDEQFVRVPGPTGRRVLELLLAIA